MDALRSHVTQTVHDGILLDGLVGKPDRNNVVNKNRTVAVFVGSGRKKNNIAALFVKHKPLSVLHIVWVAWSLLVNVTTGPLLKLPVRIYHSWIVCRMGALEILVPIGGRGHTTTLGRMLLHPHVRTECGITLRQVLKNKCR